MSRICDFCIVGTGKISRNFIEALYSAGGKCLGVYSRSAESGEAFSKSIGGVKIYTDLNLMLRASGAEAVYIASPNMCHAEVAIAAMKCGLSVLCEKIMANSTHELGQMIETARECGVTLLEAMRPAHDPITNKISDLIHEIAPIRYIRLEFSQYSSRYDDFKSGIIRNAFNPDMKNSALRDLGVYPLYMAVRLFGMPRVTSAVNTKLCNGFSAEGEACLEWDNMSGRAVFSKIRHQASPSIIEGDGGKIYINKMNNPDEIIIERTGSYAKHIESSPVSNNMIYEIEAFSRICCEGGGEIHLMHSRQVMQLVEEIEYAYTKNQGT